MRRFIFLFVLAVLPLGCCCGEQENTSLGNKSQGQDAAVTQPSQAGHDARPEPVRKTD